MSRYLILLVVSLPLLLGAHVYKKVEPDGSVTYSQHPSPGAEEGQVHPSPKYKSPEVPSPTKDVPASEPPFRYTAFAIVSPRNNEGLRQNVGNVDLKMELNPPLQEAINHRIVVFVDGAPILEDATSTVIQLTNLERGAHTLQASVVDDEGRELIRTAAVTVNLQRRRTPVRGPLPPQKPFKPFKPLPPHSAGTKSAP